MPKSRIFIHSSTIPAAPQAVWDWHMHPDALRLLTPWWTPVSVLAGPPQGGLSDGARVLLRVWMGPVPVRWVAAHESFTPPESFVDVQEEGPFRLWRHTHSFEPVPIPATGESATRYVDMVEYSTGLPVVLEAVAAALLEIQFRFLFRHRHAVVRRHFADHGNGR